MIYLLVVLAYLLGSILFAVICAKIMHLPDPRGFGSGNAGATNMMRSGDKKAGIFTFLGDLLKGVLAVGIAQLLLNDKLDGNEIIALSGIFVVIGHIFPIYFKFKGGKGVATALGVFLAYIPYLGLAVAITWVIIFKIFKISSFAAISAMILAPIYAYFLLGNDVYFGATLIISLFVLYKHKPNLIRLINRQEHRFDKSST